MAILPRSFSFLTSFFLALTVLSFVAKAERYSVEEDSFGNFTAQKVEGVLEKRAEQSNQLESPSQSEQDVPPTQPVSSERSEQSESLESEKQPRKISIFEQKYLESERKAKAKVTKQILQPGESEAAYDATEVNPLNFIDGDDLVKYGGREKVEKAPYYITVDADGRQHNTFYDPELVKDALKKQQQNNIEFTSATVFERPGQNQAPDYALSPEADPIAANILNLDKPEMPTYFQAFSEYCCADLPNREIPNLVEGKPRFFSLTTDDLPYRFNEGDSRFLLLRLPSETNENYPLKLKTFIRKHKRQSIDHGVFFPQVVTLNKDRQVVRIFTGPLLTYHEETWSTHGYLEGAFEVDRSDARDEQYLLVNTTKEALKASSTIETDDETITIQHMNIGSFEILIPFDQ